MRRVVVLGARGFFGAAALRMLREGGCDAVAAARTAGEGIGVVVDAEDGESLRAGLRAGDVVLDAAGPFQRRTTVLVEAATDVGFDVVDLADDLRHVERVMAMDGAVRAAGVRVRTAWSTVSAVSAALLGRSGIADPVRFSGFLVPAARYTAVGASTESLLSSVGRPVRSLEEGRMVERAGWTTARRVEAMPGLGSLRGRLFESADAVTLPLAWPGLRTVASYVDLRIPLAAAALDVAARSGAARAVVLRLRRTALPLARMLGRADGGYGCEVEGADGRVARLALVSGGPGYVTAVAPAVLACRDLAEGNGGAPGVRAPGREDDAGRLLALLRTAGIVLAG